MANGLDDVPLILNATLRDDFAKAFVAAQISYVGLAKLVNGASETERYRTIMWAFKLADEMLLARDGKLK